MALQSILYVITLVAFCPRGFWASEADACKDASGEICADARGSLAASAARTETEVEVAEESLLEELDVRLLQTGAHVPFRVAADGTVARLEPASGSDSPAGGRGQRTAAAEVDEVGLVQISADPIPNVTESSAKVVSAGREGVCFTDDECCPFTVGGLCDLFCKETTQSEIDTHDIKGWRLKGVCTRKWEGYCTEDEECAPTFFCQRGTSELAGVCTRDEACDKVACGRGQCRNGTCTCDYGVAGERCDRSLEAFAFLYYGNNSENLITTRVLVRSLRAGGASQDIVAIIPQNMANDTNKEHLQILQGDGVILYYSDPIVMPLSMDKDPIIHKRWSGVMNKFAVWRMTSYSQVALVDTDLVFALDGDPPERIFEECKAPLCAVRDGDPRFMNAGVMVIVPSTQRLQHIIHVLSNEQHHFAMPEQSFLTRYAEVKANRMELQYLDRKWNSCVGGGMMHNIGWESTGYNVLHSCSWTGKPPSMQMCLPPGCAQEDQFHTVLVWQFFHIQADACILHPDNRTCVSAGINQCHWCGHYCSHSQIYCDAKLFNTSKVRDKDEPSPDQAWNIYAANHSLGMEWPKNDSSAPWNELPRGSWAWPQVAMYQILIDRFATTNEVHCAKLDDYCGGNLPGIRAKLEYLEELGVDGVILSPIVTQMPHGYHGYWTKDLTSVNPEYGNEDDIRELVVLLHERKMKAIVDVNLNHAGGPTVNSSDPESVSILKPFDRPEFYHDDNCSLMHNEDYDKGPAFLERCKLYGLPDYNHENPRVWQRLMKWVREHVDMYGFDGIRVDAARHILRSFLDHIPENGSPIPAFFEVVNGEMSYVAGYATGDYAAVYNYPLYFTLKDIFVPDQPKPKSMAALAEYMTEEAPKAGGRLLLNFLDNNDLPRFIYKLDGDMLLYHNALLCMLGMEGLPTLLYGDEQNLRGVLNFSDPLKVDNWRPPMWHQGYDTNASTFQLVHKVLWLRRRMNGLHEHKQKAIYSDHRVMLFSRGPIIFAVTNAGQKAKLVSQRVLWDNATAGGPYNKPSWVCNLLAIDPMKDCGLVLPGNLTRLHLSGEPKMYVPSEFITEYLADENKALKDKEVRFHYAVEADPKVMPFSAWHDIPRPPSIRAQALKRTARAWRPADVVMHDNPFHVWHPLPNLPPHIDLWAPPVGIPATHVVAASIDDACFYLGAGEKDGAVFVQRNNITYVLCPDSQEWCPQTVGQNVNLSHLKTVATTAQAPKEGLPVVHLTYDVWYGVYHLMVGALPSIAPFLSQLQNGTMRVFLHAGQQLVSPVLAMLGVSQSAFFPPTDPPLSEPYHFCASRMYFDMSTRPLYPRVEYVPSYLHAFRAALLPRAQGIAPPCDVNTHGIVILSRGNQTRSLRNEPQLKAALESLGRPVEIVTPGPFNFPQMVEALSRAEVIVGAHGANLANLIFAPANVKVVEIVPQVNFDFQDYHFRDLAGALNFTYVPVGQRVREDEYNQMLAEDPMTMDKALASYEVDVMKVTALIKGILK